MTKKIKELEELLNKKDNIIISLEKEKDLLKIENNKINENISQLNEQISKNKQMTKQYELKISQFPFKLSAGEKIMSIIYLS